MLDFLTEIAEKEANHGNPPFLDPNLETEEDDMKFLFF